MIADQEELNCCGPALLLTQALPVNPGVERLHHGPGDHLGRVSELLPWVNEHVKTFADTREKFAEISTYIQDHVKTLSYHPEAKRKIERRHKQLRKVYRLYECEPSAVAKMWISGACEVHQVLKLFDRGELVLRYAQRKGPKSADC